MVTSKYRRAPACGINQPSAGKPAYAKASAGKHSASILRPALRDYGGQVAHSIRHHSSSADLSIITSEDDVFIFYLTKSIFFYGVLFETSVSRERGFRPGEFVFEFGH